MTFEPTAQNIAWFLDQYRKGTLKIKPRYQRNPVWGARQKCYLIESILLGLPVPEAFIQQTTTDEGAATYAVVDGQQRIRSVLQFIGSETDPDEQDTNKFALDKLPSTSKWQNATFAELAKDEKQKFFGYRFAVRFLNTESDDDVRDMFQRLNKFLTPLKPQEVRNATFLGPFFSLAERLADDEYWAENRIVTPASIRRMGDIEFVSELLIGVLHGPQAGSSKVIDEYYTQYEDYDDEFPEQRSAVRIFEDTLKAIQKVLPDIKETRWRNKTDFYSLFVAMSSSEKPSGISAAAAKQVRATLGKLESEIDKRFKDEHAHVSEDAVEYVRAVEKGANDKPRRAARHLVLLRVFGKYLKFKQGGD